MRFTSRKREMIAQAELQSRRLSLRRKIWRWLDEQLARA
jgi:hypothetical protein